jgi:hypothetical protein
MGRVKKKANEWGMQRVAGVREYRKLPVDQELSKGTKGEVRILPDGRVLYTLGAIRGGTTWPSREVFTEYRRREDEEFAKARSAPHPAVALLPPIDDFLRDVEAHAKSLGPRLSIPDEVLDGSVASLGAVDKALKRIPLAERPVADLVTPLVAYMGEVLRRASGGRWIKLPPTYTVREPVYAPGEMEAWGTARNALNPIAEAAAKQAGAEARARRASASDVALAINGARDAVYRESDATQPKPIRFNVVEKPLGGSENAPMIVASNGQSFDPFGDVYVPMIEPSKRPPLRATVEARLHGAGYPQAPAPAA